MELLLAGVKAAATQLEADAREATRPVPGSNIPASSVSSSSVQNRWVGRSSFDIWEELSELKANISSWEECVLAAGGDPPAKLFPAFGSSSSSMNASGTSSVAPGFFVDCH